VHAADGPPRFRVLGDRGAFVSHGLDQQETALRAGASPADPGFGRRDPDVVGGACFHDGSGTAEPIQLQAGRWTAFYPAVVTAIHDGGAPPVTPGEAVGVLDVLEAARDGAARGVVVAVG
jgi:scyllo-inositol 2-dehydrogenase (NADP+)